MTQLPSFGFLCLAVAAFRLVRHLKPENDRSATPQS
jgi:hypothetical protein